MSQKLIIFLALFGISYAFTLPAEYAVIDAINSELANPATKDDIVIIVVKRDIRQVHKPEPLQDGQRGRIDVTGEQAWRNDKNMGTDFNADATTRLWQNQDGHGTVNGGFANFNYRF